MLANSYEQMDDGWWGLGNAIQEEEEEEKNALVVYLCLPFYRLSQREAERVQFMDFAPKPFKLVPLKAITNNKKC